jgi:hypothetical protein
MWLAPLCALAVPFRNSAKYGIEAIMAPLAASHTAAHKPHISAAFAARRLSGPAPSSTTYAAAASISVTPMVRMRIDAASASALSEALRPFQ